MHKTKYGSWNCTVSVPENVPTFARGQTKHDSWYSTVPVPENVPTSTNI